MVMRRISGSSDVFSGNLELGAILEDLRVRTKEQSSKLIGFLRRRDQVKPTRPLLHATGFYTATTPPPYKIKTGNVEYNLKISSLYLIRSGAMTVGNFKKSLTRAFLA